MKEDDASLNEFDTFPLMCGQPEDPRLTALWKSRIAFDWRTLPSVDSGVTKTHPIDNVERWKIDLETGREIILGTIFQDRAYDGWLEGFPRNPDVELRGAYQKALELFPDAENPPLVLPPTLFRGTMMSQDGEGGHEDWLLLPRIRTIALFDSNSPARDIDESCSSMVLVWFQNSLGLPTDETLLRNIRSTDWESLAWDWSH